MTNEELMELAIKARANANCKLTGYSVGAALLCGSNKIYNGVNIESSDSCSNSNCAERVALASAIANGETEFIKIAVSGSIKNEEVKSMSPCGVCRQFILEFAPNLSIIFMDNGKIIEKKVSELMNYTYSSKI